MNTLINELRKRMNVRCYQLEVEDKITPIALYEDHRYILFVLWKSYKLGLLDPELPVNILRFDYHEDACDPIPTNERLNDLLSNNLSEKDFLSFVEWELSSNDDDWLKVGLKLNIIGDVISIGNNKGSFLSRFDTVVEDHKSNKHHIYNLSSLDSALTYQGELVDTARSHEFLPLWNLLNWDGENFISQTINNLIVNIDLDYFTTDTEGYIHAWREDIFILKIDSNSKVNDKQYSTLTFLKQCIKSAKLITIALESNCCGGIIESTNILMMIDRLLFNNTITRITQ